MTFNIHVFLQENLVASFVLEFCERGSPTCDSKCIGTIIFFLPLMISRIRVLYLLYLPSSNGSLLINGEEA
ncbi:hypothetical protein LguiA_030374 [Lonicera macranthoides]